MQRATTPDRLRAYLATAQVAHTAGELALLALSEQRALRTKPANDNAAAKETRRHA